MSHLQSFAKAVDQLAAQYQIEHVFIYAANSTASLEHHKGLPIEAVHGVLKSLTKVYSVRCERIVQSRLEAGPK